MKFNLVTLTAITFGNSSDKLVSADYTGVELTDLAFW